MIERGRATGHVRPETRVKQRERASDVACGGDRRKRESVVFGRIGMRLSKELTTCMNIIIVAKFFGGRHPSDQLGEPRNRRKSRSAVLLGMQYWLILALAFGAWLWREWRQWCPKRTQESSGRRRARHLSEAARRKLASVCRRSVNRDMNALAMRASVELQAESNATECARRTPGPRSVKLDDGEFQLRPHEPDVGGPLGTTVSDVPCRRAEFGATLISACERQMSTQSKRQLSLAGRRCFIDSQLDASSRCTPCTLPVSSGYISSNYGYPRRSVHRRSGAFPPGRRLLTANTR